MNIKELADNIIQGDRLSLSKALTLVESKRKEDISASRELINSILPASGNALRLGITGAPGVGKSTIIEKLGETILETPSRLAVLSVDPTSPTSGGSILGDKTRMEGLSRHPKVFVRPSPSGIEGGGVAVNTRDQITLCEAAGFDVVIVETVGVGQAETAVSLMVDYLLLLLLPGSGDELQGIKRGIMEVAQAFAFTKSDILEKSLINQSVSDLRMALHMIHEDVPEIFTCSGVTGDGIDEIWKAVIQFSHQRKEEGSWEANRRQQDLHYFDTLLRKNLWLEFLSQKDVEKKLGSYRDRIASLELSPQSAVDLILEDYFKDGK